MVADFGHQIGANNFHFFNDFQAASNLAQIITKLFVDKNKMTIKNEGKSQMFREWLPKHRCWIILQFSTF